MEYLSTRDASLRKRASEAIVMGLARDGGLYTPVSFPTLTPGDLEKLGGMSYPERAAWIMKQFLEEFTQEELNTYTRKAYRCPEKFDTPAAAPVVARDERTSVLELWHGPTCAFKDMALQMLPYLLSASLQKTGEKKTVCILVATSGDTGKAALEGFRDVEQTRILVFYPKDGVSEIQQLQMTTQEGGNVGVEAVEGNFDDAQNGVKRIFSDEEMREVLSARGYFLSSANSINWGRILPQVVYYVSAYCDLVSQGRIAPGQEISFCVPTGNFGDILAGYFAKCMGLPVKKLICASNANNVLTDFLRTGVYDRNRPFYHTTSPSMDILISSNLERLLYLLSGSDEEVRGYMERLNADGRYAVSERLFARLKEEFACGFADDRRAAEAIRSQFEQGYLMDPHTAVAWAVLEDYRAATGDDTFCVVLSTANPYKFCSSVLDALDVPDQKEGTAILSQMEAVTGVKAPAPLAELEGKRVRFDGSCEKQDMEKVVLEFLS